MVGTLGLSAEPLVGLKHRSGPTPSKPLTLSAEPLVGLKRGYVGGPAEVHRLSAEPLVGLKQHRAVLYGAVLYGFQPNPSWV